MTAAHLFIVSSLTLVGLTACGPARLDFRAGLSGNNQVNTVNVVCQPAGPGGGAQNGLQATLYYLTPGSQPLNSVNDYITTGIKDPTTFFWNQLYVPTEIFSHGFQKQDGTLLKTPSGVVLTENFALDFRTSIGLSSVDAPGDYQFALLSDDGALLNIADTKGNFKTIVDNDGQHPTQFGCANSVIHLDAATRLTSQIKYYQGPRDHIALILLWRKIAAGTAVLDQTFCGDNGNTLFFDPSTVPSVPQQEYKDILGRGWSPLKPANYNLPNGGTNPCVI